MNTKDLAVKLGFVTGASKDDPSNGQTRRLNPSTSKIPVALPISLPLYNRVPLVSTASSNGLIPPTSVNAPEPMESSSQTSHRSHEKKSGQCSVCLRVICLTSTGLIYKHGPGCTGSSQLPIDGSISNSQPQGSMGSSIPSSTEATTKPCNKSSKEIIDLLLAKQGKVLKRIPKASRILAAERFVKVLTGVISDADSVDKWIELLLFGVVCFAVPGNRGGKKHCSSLATKVNQVLISFPLNSETPNKANKPRNFKQTPSSLAARVSNKLEDGDIRGAIRLAASDNTMAEETEETVFALKSKHPQQAMSYRSPPAPENNPVPQISIEESAVRAVIKSFQAGSSGGIAGLKPQHLKDMTSALTGDAGITLLRSLTEFTNLCLLGRIPNEIQPIFCGASLCALKKVDGSIRPIAVGCTLRRLVAKAACFTVKESTSSLFVPTQLGFGVSRAAEAAVHVTRCYVDNLKPGQGILKLDFINAFNTIHRDSMLQAVLDELLGLYSFIHKCYANSSYLIYGDHIISSEEGCQQGDALGPLLFCLSTRNLAKDLFSELNIWYLDDGLIGGRSEHLLNDLSTIRSRAADLGLVLNDSKCEIISNDVIVIDEFRREAPNILSTRCEEALFLGAPIGDQASVTKSLDKKLIEFKRLCGRLQVLNSHDAFFLLRNCFSVPKLLYTLRSAPCYANHLLKQYDDTIRNILQLILNISLSDSSWDQASLPISSGGLGVRLATHLALPAFLSSVAGSLELVKKLTPPRLHDSVGELDPYLIAAREEWLSLSSFPCPDSSISSIQKAWDSPLVNLKKEKVLSAAQSQAGRARLIAAAAPHSGDFLTAVPCSSVGNRLDDSSLRIAIALRLGAPVCAPHECICGELTDELGVHGLSCRKSAGRHFRHSAVNDLIKRSLASAEIPSRLEPTGIVRNNTDDNTDNKRPDGLTIAPWTSGRCLVWDFTCPDTLAVSHLNRAVLGPGTVACDAESRKKSKYASLSDTTYNFIPIAVETIGALGDEASAFFKDSSKRIERVTSEPRSEQFIMQTLSITIQRGNAACILGTVHPSKKLDELFYV